MPSDHTNASLWRAEAADTAYEPLVGDRQCDVVVVGAGITGLLIAHRLRGDGADVVVVESGQVAGGVTGNTTGKVSALQGTIYSQLEQGRGAAAAAAYAAANAAAVDDIATLIERGGIDCDWTRAPDVTYVLDPREASSITAEVAAAQRAGLAVQESTETDLPFAVAAAAVLGAQAHFQPVRFCIGVAEALGADQVFEGTHVHDVEEDGDGVLVRTESGEIRAQHAVVATQSPIVDPGFLTGRGHPARSYAMAVAIDGPVPAGMYISADEPTRSLRPAHSHDLDRPVVIVGGEGHQTGFDEDTTQRFYALERWAQETFTGSRVLHRWSAHDLVTTDLVPYIGRLHPRSQRRWVATGFRKWGMTNAMVAARIIADGIAGRDNPWAQTFDATRLAPTISRSLLEDGAKVARRFVGDRVAAARRGRGFDPDTLGRGDGVVVRMAGQPVAVSRASDDVVQAVSAVCTHLGCLVAWNTAERSWDCPCHGSRFAADGTVLQGPADEDLAEVDVSGEQGFGDATLG